MYFLAKIILIVLIFLNAGCHSYAVREGHINFSTPFGVIAKGDSMRKIVKILGNPAQVSYYQRKEIWRYKSSGSEDIFVYFENGNVSDVRFSNQPCSDCRGSN